jgi:hypothetical protein
VESLKALGAAFEIDFSQLKEPDMNTTLHEPIPGQANSSAAFSGQSVRADEALALAHVRKLKAFYIHLGQYALVIALLAVLNLWTSPHYFWVLFPALGWGIGLSFHGLQVFDMVPFLSGDWERQQVEKYLGRKL